MKPETWKIIAIVFTILFLVETTLVCWAFWYVGAEEDDYNECVFNVCDEYPYADYIGGICYCYNVDVYGEYILEKTKVIK